MGILKEFWSSNGYFEGVLVIYYINGYFEGVLVFK